MKIKLTVTIDVPPGFPGIQRLFGSGEWTLDGALQTAADAYVRNVVSMYQQLPVDFKENHHVTS
jgi:hypothetical protein